MGSRVLLLALCAVLLAACHGPPIMSRITPRHAQPRYAAPTTTPVQRPQPRPHRADPMRAPFLEREGRPESIVTDKMIDDIERAVLLRRKAKAASADPCSQAIERARRMKYQPRVGQEERGAIAIPIPCPPELIKKLWQAVSK